MGLVLGFLQAGSVRAALITISLAIGISAVLIGLMFFLLGAQFTADVFSLVPYFLGDQTSITGFDLPDVDGEFRFYSVFWFAYGVALIKAAIDLESRLHWIPVLAGLFFMGGVGRVLSIVIYGWPHSLFQILLAVEIVTPIIMLVLWHKLRKAT